MTYRYLKKNVKKNMLSMTAATAAFEFEVFEFVSQSDHNTT